jgi:hypothetical protein
MLCWGSLGHTRQTRKSCRAMHVLLVRLAQLWGECLSAPELWAAAQTCTSIHRQLDQNRTLTRIWVFRLQAILQQCEDGEEQCSSKFGALDVARAAYACDEYICFARVSAVTVCQILIQQRLLSILPQRVFQLTRWTGLRWQLAHLPFQQNQRWPCVYTDENEVSTLISPGKDATAGLAPCVSVGFTATTVGKEVESLELQMDTRCQSDCPCNSHAYKDYHKLYHTHGPSAPTKRVLHVVAARARAQSNDWMIANSDTSGVFVWEQNPWNPNDGHFSTEEMSKSALTRLRQQRALPTAWFGFNRNQFATPLEERPRNNDRYPDYEFAVLLHVPSTPSHPHYHGHERKNDNNNGRRCYSSHTFSRPCLRSPSSAESIETAVSDSNNTKCRIA